MPCQIAEQILAHSFDKWDKLQQLNIWIYELTWSIVIINKFMETQKRIDADKHTNQQTIK